MYNLLKSLFDVFQPPFFESITWKNWIAIIDEKLARFAVNIMVKSILSMRLFNYRRRFIHTAGAR